MDINPVCIILVKNGSRGDRLLFKYPYAEDEKETRTRNRQNKKCNPYSVAFNGSTPSNIGLHASNISHGKLAGFSDKDMSNLFAVKSELCDRKFELKVNDVRFVGYPLRLNPHHLRPAEKKKSSTIVLFHIVFALKATLSHDVVNCYHNLSQQLGLALRHEEYRCHFLSAEAKKMLAFHDEVSHHPEDAHVSPYELILQSSLLAQHLKQTYQELCASGIVQFRLNKWIEVSFCLPQKVHHCLGTGRPIDHQVLLRSLQKLKPYHTLLLLVETPQLLQSLSADASPALRRLLHVQSPLNPFYTLAADADLTLPQVFMLAGHLVYWGKATIIYPVCSTNIYVLSPHTPTQLNSELSELFSETFFGSSLHNVLAEFSLPTSLSDKCHPTSFPRQQQEQVQQVLWLLKHKLLQQLHTYIYLSPLSNQSSGPRECGISRKDIARSEGYYSMGVFGSHGTSSPSSTSIPTPTVNEPSSTIVSSQVLHEPPTNDILHHHVNSNIHLSQPPSESDIGSVCSDERSPSPGVSTSTLPEDSAFRKLEIYLTEVEKEMVMKVEAAHNPDDLKLFASLCQYFRGLHHLEEMMYRANLRRSQLLAAIDKFRQILITCQHPDYSLTLTVQMELSKY